MRTSERGQSLVEFSLILPVLVLVIFAILDFGRAVFFFSSLDSAARTGARFAVTNQNVTSANCSVDPINSISCAVIRQAVGLGTTPSDVTVAFRQPDDSAECAARTIGCLASVSVRYQFTAVTPVISAIVPSIAMTRTSILPIERTCPSGTTGSCSPIP